MFFEVDGKIYKKDDIREIDISDIENLKISIFVNGTYIKPVDIEGIDAINFIYRCCPHVLEGKRLKWLKHRWFIHNFIGHPLMQLLSFFGCYKMAMKIHDCTIPKPIGEKEPNLSEFESYGGRLEIFYGQDTEGMMVWNLERTDVWVNKDNYWDRIVDIEDGDYLVIWDDGVIVWKGFIEKEVLYNYGARWWPKDFNKYQRLDWQEYFLDNLNATLYRRSKNED